MQKGLTTLEIIFAIMIIALLARAAVLNAIRLVDAVSLNYETKIFCSDLRFVQAKSRSSMISSKGMGKIIEVEKPNLIIELAERRYQVFINDKPIREPHLLSNGVKISLKNHDKVKKIEISFDMEGKADIKYNDLIAGDCTLNDCTLIFTSQFDKNKFIKLNSVGRIRSSSADE